MRGGVRLLIRLLALIAYWRQAPAIARAAAPLKMGCVLALARGTRGQAPVCIRCAGTVQHAGSLVLHMCACLDM